MHVSQIGVWGVAYIHDNATRIDANRARAYDYTDFHDQVYPEF